MSMLKSATKISANSLLVLFRLGKLAVIIIGFYFLYRFLLEQSFDGSNEVIPLLLLWVISAYIVIPRIHRTLNKYYLPNYFVGRVRSPSGFLSDPVNIAFFGSEKDVKRAMEKAKWVKADPLTIKNAVKTALYSLLQKSYPSAPVGRMYLFNRQQDFTYEIEVNGSPNERHHIRFWKTPKNWYLPGGHRAHWLAAATHDTHVGIKIATGQIDHFIHEDIDIERDFVIASLKTAGVAKKVEVVKHFTDAYHDRNNGGDRIKTDGSLPFVYL